MKIIRCILEILKSGKGSLMVEAAFLYPFIIVVSVSLLFIMVNFYQMTSLKAELDVAALSEGGIHSGVYVPKDWNLVQGEEAEVQRNGIYESMVVTFSRAYGDWGILKRTEEKKEIGEFVSLKESDYLRKTIILKEGE